MLKPLFCAILLASALQAQASYLLLQMDETQKNHLKAYGVAYKCLAAGVNVDWLLNYKGGSFAVPYAAPLEAECRIRGVSYTVLADGQYNQVIQKIADPEVNMDVVKLEKAPKIAVYTPKEKPHHPELPWDDAVTLVLEYAEIPFDALYDEEVLKDKLTEYDWLHLHHEDFTGQYGKFYASYGRQQWYIDQVAYEEKKAKELGFNKVSQMKLAVAQKIKEYVAGGGFMFAMCSATDSYDISLSAAGVDICEAVFDHDSADPNAQSKLDFHQCLAFENFSIIRSPTEYEFSNIDMPAQKRPITQDKDYFTLFEFSAKWDPVPSMLTQDHTDVVKGFMGQTTAFNKKVIKKDVLVMGENKPANEARYIHGDLGKGFWTFYGGHDPEDYQHFVGEPETDLSLHPNSPGYRLILNNVLFPAARKKHQKT